MTDPEFADATYVEPITAEFVEKVIEKERPDALLATLGGQTALNTAMDLDRLGVLEKYGVELIGASIEAINRGENRESFKKIVEELGGEVARSAVCHTLEDCFEAVRRPGLADGGAPQLHDGRHRLRDGLRRGRPAPDRRGRTRRQPDHRGAPRGVDHRLEGVRARGHARHRRQRGDRVLDREPRPDGRAHRRLDHGRAGDDADRPRVPAPARPLDRHHPLGRRGHRRLQHPVRGEPRRRPRGRDRDEPAGLAVQRAGLQGDRLPDRQDRRQGGDRLHPRRDPQRHHRARRRPASSRRWTTSW